MADWCAENDGFLLVYLRNAIKQELHASLEMRYISILIKEETFFSGRITELKSFRDCPRQRS